MFCANVVYIDFFLDVFVGEGEPNVLLLCHLFLCVCVCVCFLGLHPWHMEVPRLGVKLEL